MATTLPTLAPEIATLSSAVYEINNSDFGTAPITKWAGYKVLDGSANELTTTQRMPNKTGGVLFDVSKVLSSIVYTPFPGLDTLNVTTIMGYAANYSLSYGDISFDADACETTNTLTSSTTGRQVVNAYLEPWEDAGLYDSGDLIVLSDKPSRVKASAEQSDYIYFYRKSGSVYCLCTMFFTDGTTAEQSTSIALNGSAGYISVGPANLFAMPSKAMSGYKLEFYDDVGLTNLVKTIDYEVEQICNDDSSATTLYWLNKKGGWESLQMEDFSGSVGRDQALYNQSIISNAANRESEGGLRGADLRATRVLSLLRTMDASQETYHYIQSLLSGREFYVKYFNGTEFIAHRCEIQNGTFGQVSNKEVNLQLPVILSQPI